jgi:hypothetical protein
MVQYLAVDNKWPMGRLDFGPCSMQLAWHGVTLVCLVPLRESSGLPHRLFCLDSELVLESALSQMACMVLQGSAFDAWH